MRCVLKLLIFFILGICNIVAQIKDVEEKFNLPTILNESSGAIFFNNKLISHNDSGNQNTLYELDTISGLITRTITINNATNIDWEDITQDNTSIYIGDIGNNNGNRTDLKIYKINKNDYLTSTNVTSEIISFSYSDQTNFTSNPNNTEWDSEAIISFNENLILFTKNWLTGITKAYSIPKNSGIYTVSPLTTSLTSGGLITGATYNEFTGKVYSIGYNSSLEPFIWISENFTNNDIFSGTNTKIPLTSLAHEQAEAITYINPNRYFITSESFNISGISDYAKLVTFSTNDESLSINKQNINYITLHPNPVKDVLTIKGGEFVSLEIYDINSRLLQEYTSREINISKLKSGIYLAKINLTNNSYLIKKLIKR